MVSKKYSFLYKDVLEMFQPEKKELEKINEKLRFFLDSLESTINSKNISAKPFVGGSFAKGTLIKKEEYDVDIFLRFDNKYDDGDISKLTKDILKSSGNKKFLVNHGSRDYFKLPISLDDKESFFEIVPILKVSKPENAVNITDLSYFHVNYVGKRLQTDNQLNEVKLAKAFCQAQRVYGAESYIQGFSGYALELLIYYYGDFIKMLKALSKHKKGEKIFLDPEKKYKNQNEIKLELNSSKLNSPVILIDPTYGKRNALAALSEKSFEKFKQSAKMFLESPSKDFFIRKSLDIEKIKKSAKKNKQEFLLLQASTAKQSGDIAGTKLHKFYLHLVSEIEEFFSIKNNGFNYNGGKSARYFFVFENRKEKLYTGPHVNDRENFKSFIKKHKNTFVKEGRIYASEKIDFNSFDFIKNWKKRNKKRMKEMYIKNLKIIESVI